MPSILQRDAPGAVPSTLQRDDALVDLLEDLLLEVLALQDVREAHGSLLLEELVRQDARDARDDLLREAHGGLLLEELVRQDARDARDDLLRQVLALQNVHKALLHERLVLRNVREALERLAIRLELQLLRF